ncbi:MAG TPA: ABC transporter ATP-binding protein [Acidobacteriota bacterium]|nr:ABC transporter ATP-binding protein [Acidobacteriota bacterium]
MPEEARSANKGHPAIRTRGATKRFGELTAVDSLDLEVDSGEVFGFLGPNGAGKSTLMRMLMGLMKPTEGQVEVLGLCMPEQADALRTRIGYMAQRFSLYQDLTVEENLEFAAEVYGISPHRERVEEALHEFGLQERRKQRPATLSGGWRQRLALAAANIHRPELLVLDEPTAGVDPENRRLFWDKLFLLAARGTTILVSTHYMDEAIRCYRLCMMRRGRKAIEGRPAELSRAMSGRVLRLRLERLDEAAALLRQVPEVSGVAQIGGSLRVLMRPDAPPSQQMLAPLTDRLMEAGLGPVDGSSVEANLEDVFVALTHGEDLRAGEEAA